MNRAHRQLAPQPMQLPIPLIAEAGEHDRSAGYRGVSRRPDRLTLPGENTP